MSTAPRPKISVQTSVAGRYADVSQDRLRSLVEGLGEQTDFEFVICEKEGEEGSFAQAAVTPPQVRGGKKFTVEYREGDHTNHWQALTDDIGTVAQVLAGWAYELAGWKSLVSWKKIDLGS